MELGILGMMFLVTKDASVEYEAVGDGKLLLDLGWTPVLVV